MTNRQSLDLLVTQGIKTNTTEKFNGKTNRQSLDLLVTTSHDIYDKVTNIHIPLSLALLV